MLYALIGLGVVAAALLAMLVLGQQKSSGLASERDDLQRQLSEAQASLSASRQQNESLQGQVDDLGARRSSLEASVKQFESKLTDTSESLRKRTELADAQAMQIDALSAERDDLKGQILQAEERLVTLAARPGVVVGSAGKALEASAEGADTSVLWDLELARSERVWRTSVATNPQADLSPFDGVDDKVRRAVEIEAAALREDVGALITIDWQAAPIASPSRSLTVLRVAQEVLASASRAPGAAKLVVTDTEGGELSMRFESADDGGEVINLIPPQIANDLIDVRNGSSLSLKVSDVAGGLPSDA